MDKGLEFTISLLFTPTTNLPEKPLGLWTTVGVDILVLLGVNYKKWVYGTFGAMFRPPYLLT